MIKKFFTILTIQSKKTAGLRMNETLWVSDLKEESRGNNIFVKQNYLQFLLMAFQNSSFIPKTFNNTKL